VLNTGKLTEKKYFTFGSEKYYLKTSNSREENTIPSFVIVSMKKKDGLFV
jgi:hypothetical protein